jgi:enoyl-[acyl-carrier protein] reductase I
MVAKYMGFLTGRRILITGMLSRRSIAFGVARAMHREGAQLAFTYQGETIRERVEELALGFGECLVLPCDVASDEQIAAVFNTLAAKWGVLDGLVHAIAFAPREALAGAFHASVNRENFRIAHDISAYSLAALVKAAAPLMQGREASVVAMSYLGAERAVPNYNVMGLAKASLEACVRYLAYSLGPGGLRVNALSAGPIKTPAASGVGDFNRLLSHTARNSALRRNVTIDDVGNVAAFLASPLAAGITGETIYVDAGFRMSGLAPEKDEA